MEKFNINSYGDKTTKTYSGGTKRKFSVALALLGEPELVLLVNSTLFIMNKQNKQCDDEYVSVT